MPNISHIKGYVIVLVDVEEKLTHDLGDGKKLFIVRGVENFNRRETEPVQGTVVTGDGLEKGDVVLLHHNSVDDFFRLNYLKPEGSKHYFAVPATQVYAKVVKGTTIEDDKIIPLAGFLIGLRCFKQPSGFIITQMQAMKNKLWAIDGKFKDVVVNTVNFCDYEIMFQWRGKLTGIIRFRDEEIVSVDNAATAGVRDGSILTGLNVVDANDKFKSKLPKGWNSISVTPPDCEVKVIDAEGKIITAIPTFYPFTVETRKVNLCKSHWDGGWIYEVGMSNTKPIGDIIGWKLIKRKK